MAKDSARMFAMVVSAIKNLRELKGSTSREILHYLSSVYNIPTTMARRQAQTALKRGVTFGILKKNGGHYILPTSSDMKLREIAEQEVSLLDAYRQCKRHRLIGCKCKGRRRSRRRKRTFCRCKPKRSSRKRRRSRVCVPRRRKRRRKCRCGGLGSKGDRRRLKRPISHEALDKLSRERSHEQPAETNESANSENSSFTSVSSIAD